jgi:type III pantothenate kinase
MLLALDAGNTHIVVGAFEGSQLRAHWRLSTQRDRPADEYGVLLRHLFTLAPLPHQAVDAAILSCVVPPLTPVLERAVERYFGARALLVEPGIRTGMPILYENPQEVGADRIVNGIAAYARTQGPTLVVDFGTATTFDAISARGEYLGGAIAPGLGVSAEALFARTARLPRVEVRQPPRLIGRNTVLALQSGLFYGYVALVEGMVRRLREEMGGEVRVIATGGHAETLGPALECVDEIDPLLTLEGLRLLYERTRA